MTDNCSKTIFVGGHRGMVGSAIVRQLQTKGYRNIIFRDRASLDLSNQAAVCKFFTGVQVDEVYLAAARVGGIHANNTYPADFIYQNLMIQSNVIHQAHLAGVQRLLFLGSSCIYPKLSEQPIREEALLTGLLEPTNEPYAIAKIAGIKLCESYNRQYGRDYRSVMPTNLYGPGDNYHPDNSHVVPALIRRIAKAKFEQDPSVEVWGSGNPRRDFLHVDDMASACVCVMDTELDQYQALTQPMLSHINVGSGEDVEISALVGLIARIVGYQGEMIFDTSKPDGTYRKCLEISRMGKLGWKPSFSLEQGLSQVVEAYLSSMDDPVR
ncbi:MAG: GDP-L-fucose synthase [Halopseudomonas sp.]